MLLKNSLLRRDNSPTEPDFSGSPEKRCPPWPKMVFLARTIALLVCVEPVFALDPVPDPAGEAGTRGGIAELGTEWLGSHADDVPHVPAVRAGGGQAGWARLPPWPAAVPRR